MPNTRPTTDLAKEGLFNILQNMIDFDEIESLELFAGTGSISYELASRGAANLTIIERDKAMATFILKNAAALGFNNMNVLQLEVFRFLNGCKSDFDFIFADPPYALPEMELIPDLIFDNNLLRRDGLFVLEHTPRNEFEHHARFIKVKNYGTTLFSFFGFED